MLLVGGGGREHALAWKLAQSPGLGRMIAAPGNPGIAAHARCVPIKDTAIDELVALGQQERPDLVVVGPASPAGCGPPASRSSGAARPPRASRARRPSPRT